MNPTYKNLLIFAAGLATGAMAVSMARNSGLRPALTNIVADALELKDKTLCAIERARENAGDLLAEADHARKAKAAKTEAPKDSEDKPSGETA